MKNFAPLGRSVFCCCCCLLEEEVVVVAVVGVVVVVVVANMEMVSQQARSFERDAKRKALLLNCHILWQARRLLF